MYVICAACDSPSFACPARALPPPAPQPPIINGTGVYLTVMRAFTIQYLNVLLTNTLGGTYPLLPQNLGLAQLQSAGGKDSLPYPACA